jgi:hypothetical protein
VQGRTWSGILAARVDDKGYGCMFTVLRSEL